MCTNNPCHELSDKTRDLYPDHADCQSDTMQTEMWDVTM